ncbi:MAG: hypothetical protein QXX95_04645 [Nitrososphaerales archaeon]
MRKFVIFLLLFVLLISSFPSFEAKAENFTILEAIWGTPENPSEAGPGVQNVPLTVTLQYFGTSTITSLHATLILPQEFKDVDGKDEAKAQVTGLTSNSIFRLTFKLNIDPNAKNKSYTLPLTLKYNTTISKNLSENIEVTIQLKGKVRLVFEASQEYLIPGQINSLRLIILNQGSGDAHDISITLSTPPQLSLLNTFSNIPTLKASSSTSLELKLYVSSAASNSPLTLSLSSTYKDAYFNTRSVTQTLGFFVKEIEEPFFNISSSLQSLIAGEFNQLSLLIENKGFIEMREIFLTINFQPPLTLMNSDGRFNLGDLRPGKSITIPLKIYVSPTILSTASISITISFTDSSNLKRVETRSLSFFLSSEGNFSVLDTSWGINNSYEAGPGDINAPLIVSLQYFGNTNLESLNATLSLPEGFKDVKGLKKTSAYISNIPSNSIFQLTFHLNLDDNAQIGIYQIPLILNWNTSLTKGIKDVKSLLVPLKGKVKLSLTSENRVLTPGQINEVQVQLNNIGTATAYDLSLSLVLPPQLSLLNTLPKISKLESNSKESISLQLYVAPNTALIPFSLSFTVTYKDAYGNSKTISETLGFQVKSIKPTTFQISSSTNTLNSEEINQVKLKVKNITPFKIKDLQVFLSTQIPLSLLDSDGKFFLGDLEAGHELEFPVKLYIAPTSLKVASITLSFTYTDESEMSKSESRMMSFLVSIKTKLSPISLTLKPTTLIAGKVNNMTFTLSNNGSYALRSLSLTFSGLQLTWLEPEFIQLDILKPKESINIQAKAYAPILTTSNLQVNVKFYDENDILNQEVRNFGLLIKGIVDIRLTEYSLVPENPSVGEPFSLVGTITNLGTIPASGITVYPKLPEGFSVLGSPSAFIGDLPINALDTFTITLTSSKSLKPGIYKIPLEVSYMDNLRNELSQLLTLNVEIKEKTITETPERSSPTLSFEPLLQYMVLVGVALSVGYFLGKRKKSSK